MKKNIALLLIAISLVSCISKNHKYNYIEVNEETGIFGDKKTVEKDPKVIEAISDSAAYLKAFEYYCIALKVTNDMIESFGSCSTIPVDFKLLNEEGIDISETTFFRDKNDREISIKGEIFSMANNLKESLDKNRQEKAENFKETVKIDSSKVIELSKYFRIKTDEFSNDNKKWYEPKTAPKYVNRNAIYCYFQTENGVPGNLRFRIQYYAEDWLFFDRVQFSIDGRAYEFIPDDTQTDSGNGGYIWEWSDQALTSSDKDLIFALANGKNAKMKLIGSQYHDIKTITPEQLKSIKQTIDLYNAMGGGYSASKLAKY